MSYPICGCNVTAKSNCDDCYHRSKHSEMGATWSVCTQYSDLSEATRACENSKECKLKITYNQVREAIEKQTAKKPDYEADGYADGVLAYDYAKCPVCGHSFEAGVNDWGCSYCSDCGQKLDWSDDNG